MERDDNPAITGAELRTWRVLSGLSTQMAAAAALGLPLSTYIEWEVGKRPVRNPRLVALACAALVAGVKAWRSPAGLEVETPGRGRPRKVTRPMVDAGKESSSKRRNLSPAETVELFYRNAGLGAWLRQGIEDAAAADTVLAEGG